MANGAKCINSEKDLICNLKKLYLSEDFKTKTKTNFQNVSNEYKKIYSVLTKSPQNINNIAEKLNISINELQSKLFMMELDNLVIRTSPCYYIRR